MGRPGPLPFDLLTSPYWVGGIGGRIINWFAEKSPPGPAPTGVAVIGGAATAWPLARAASTPRA